MKRTGSIAPLGVVTTMLMLTLAGASWAQEDGYPLDVDDDVVLGDVLVDDPGVADDVVVVPPAGDETAVAGVLARTGTSVVVLVTLGLLLGSVGVVLARARGRRSVVG